MTLSTRTGLLMTAFAALLVAEAGCSTSKKKDAGTGTDAKDGTGQTDATDAKQDTGGTAGSAGAGGSGGAAGAGDAGTDATDAKQDTGGTGGTAGAGGTGGTAGAGGTGGTAGADGGTDATDATTLPPCAKACPAADQKRCGSDGKVQTCTASTSATCTGQKLDWSAGVACGTHQACVAAGTDASCVCNPAPAECADLAAFPGDVCVDTKNVTTCAEDADTCVFGTPKEQCSTNKTCQGADGAKACACGGPGIELCTTGQYGSYCIDGNTRGLCVFTPDECAVKKDATDCVGEQVCTGATGAAHCECPATDDSGVAHMTCTGDPDSVDSPHAACDGDTITKCTADPVGSCQTWIAQPACDAGYACTTDGDQNVEPHCGCPEVIDGNFYVSPTQGHDVPFAPKTGAAKIRPTGANSNKACNFLHIATCLHTTDTVNTGRGANNYATNAGGNTPAACVLNESGATYTETQKLKLIDEVSVTTIEGGTTPDNFIVDNSLADDNERGFWDVTGDGKVEGLTSNNRDTSFYALYTLNCGGDNDGGTRTIQHVVLNGSNASRTAARGIIAHRGCNAVVDDVVIGGLDTDAQSSAYSQNGVAVDGATVTSNGGLVVRNSGGDGVVVRNSYGTGSLVGGVFDAKDALIENNDGDGIDVDPVVWSDIRPVVKMHGGTITDNNGDGIQADGADVTVDVGSIATISNNSGDGIEIDDETSDGNLYGILTVDSADIDSNGDEGGDGIDISDSVGTVTNALVHGSDNDGIRISNAYHDPNPYTVTITGTESYENGHHGLNVIRAPKTSDLANLIFVDGGKYYANGTDNDGNGNGIQAGELNNPIHAAAPGLDQPLGAVGGTEGGVRVLAGIDDFGDVSLTVKRAEIYDNALSGIKIISYAPSDGLEDPGPPNSTGVYTRTTIQDNDIHGNHTLKGALEGDETLAAGVYFFNVSELSTFTGNHIHSNKGPEVRFVTQHKGYTVATPATYWDITSLTDTCDETANQIYCYNEAADLGVSAKDGDGNGLSVNAKWVHWRNLVPSNGVDYSDGGDMTVDATMPCSPIMACP